MPPERYGYAKAKFSCPGHISADFAWYYFVAALVATGRYMTDPVYRALLIACAIFLLALGAFFILSGVASLVGVQLMG